MACRAGCCPSTPLVRMGAPPRGVPCRIEGSADGVIMSNDNRKIGDFVHAGGLDLKRDPVCGPDAKLEPTRAS